MKANKLKLKDLKVNSFVTSLNKENAQTVQGGKSFPTQCSIIVGSFPCPGHDSIVPCDEPVGKD